MTGSHWLHRVFVDTSAFFALSTSIDTNYQHAQRMMERLRRERADGLTTNAVVAETHALLLARLRKRLGAAESRKRALQATERIYAGAISIERISEADERAALVLLARYADQDFTFTDATSFAVMHRLGIRVTFTFDDDFGRAGIADLLHV